MVVIYMYFNILHGGSSVPTIKFVCSYQTLNEISSTNNFNHIITYTLCKCHVYITFHLFNFDSGSPISKIPIFGTIWPWKPQMSCMSYSYNFITVGFKHVLKHTQLIQIFLFTQQSPIWQPPGQLCQKWIPSVYLILKGIQVF